LRRRLKNRIEEDMRDVQDMEEKRKRRSCTHIGSGTMKKKKNSRMDRMRRD
jgi:hypothetical protein